MSVDSLHNQTLVVAKGYSTVSHHYWRQHDINSLTKLQHDSSIKVTLPNAEAIPSDLKGELSLVPQLSTKVQSEIVFPQLKSSSLASLG